MTVQEQEHFHRRVTSAFVAVEERMIQNERVSESGGLVRDQGIQFIAFKCHARSGYRGLKRPGVQHNCFCPSLHHDHAMQGQQFVDCQVTHYASRR